LLNDPRTAHAAFIAETPIDEPQDDLRNVAILKSLVKAEEQTGKRIKKKQPA
jgi:deoxyribonuclease IV